MCVGLSFQTEEAFFTALRITFGVTHNRPLHLMLKTTTICFFAKSTLLEKSADGLFCDLSQYTWLLLPMKCIFCDYCRKMEQFLLHIMSKALCERPFALHRQQPENYKQNVDIAPIPEKIYADANGKGAWGHSNESLPINGVRNAAERSFSKLRLIKTFHRSTMTDERLTNLAMSLLKVKLLKQLI